MVEEEGEENASALVEVRIAAQEKGGQVVIDRPLLSADDSPEVEEAFVRELISA